MEREPQGVDPELARGLRNFWYPIFRSDDLDDKPAGIQRLGADLVLWRDSQQRVHLFADYCPHRSAKLSLGRIVGDRLACWYHGLQFEGAGRCAFVPTQPDSEPDERLRAAAYPVADAGGLIWGYVGDVERFPPPPLEVAEEFTSPEWCGWIDTQTWNVNYLLVLDNFVDSMHTPFLHAGAGAVGDVANPSRVQVIPSVGTFRVQNEPLPGYERDEPFEGMTFYLPNWIRVDIPIPGPGGPLRVLAYATPIDEERCQVFFLRTRHVQGAERQQWCEQWARQFEQITRHIVWQDEVVVGSQRGLGSRLREHLLPQDRGVMYLRQVLSRELARQRAAPAEDTAAPETKAELSAR
jgi:phenylpropionate dioxygenase-like ring-hydroxylating dioxygenase large terminal subunit